jgi:uncharacterized protein YcbK (DUF882 family)
MATAMLPAAALAAKRRPERRLNLRNLHTGETLTTVYWEKGCYDPRELSAVAHLLRDFRTGDVHDMDCRLLDFMFTVNHALGGPDEVGIICGYRSPKTNAALAAKSSSVAKHSLHMEGKAVDIRYPGIDARRVYKAALSLQGGGTGLYSRSNFVHLDVGKVRHWGA